MNKLFFYLLLITLFSCKKNYKYVEEIKNIGIIENNIEKKEEFIKAENDSTAYLEAFKKFAISQKVNNDMKKSLGTAYTIPLSFSIYDEKGNNITFKDFHNKKKSEQEIITRILSLSNPYKSISKTNKIDSAKIKELEKFFVKKKDEFSTEEKTTLKPKSAPKYINQNGIYCYFQTINNIPNNLRFKVQYYSDEWLFIKRLQFSIDGKAYEYIPLEPETDSGDGNIWEWFDEDISNSDKDLINALASAKSAKMKLIGSNYYDIKTLTKSQIDDIRRTLDLYKAMGGTF